MKNSLKILILLLILSSAFVVSHVSKAETTSTPTTTITFPIPDLGDCTSAKDCKKYCDNLAHVEACVTYGKAHGLISTDEATEGLKLKNLKVGPGGCTDRDACKAYCADPAHTEECAKFAEAHKILDQGQINKFRKLNDAIKKGDSPGDCANRDACEAYCSVATHSDECLKFAKANGLIEEDQAAKIQKFQQAIKTKSTPGDCADQDACHDYCAIEEHHAECLKFATDNGLINPDEARKLQPGNFVGPGGCKSREECAAFCKDPANQQTCLDFAKAHKILDSDQTDKIEAAGNAVREIKNLPAPVIGCIKEKLDPNTTTDIENGNSTPNEESAKIIRLCMLNFAQQNKTPDRPKPPASQDPTNTNTNTPKPTTEVRNQIPPMIRECIVRTYGEEYAKRIESGQVSPDEAKARIVKCLPPPPANVRPPEGATQNNTVREPFESDQ